MDLFEIDKLPLEILMEILSFLPFEDRRQARYVCRKWNEVLSSFAFTRQEVFVYYSNKQTISHEVSREYPFVRIEAELDARHPLEVFHRIGKSTRTLEVSWVDYCSKTAFQLLLRCFPNVSELVLNTTPRTAAGWLEEVIPQGGIRHLHFYHVDLWNDPETVSFLRRVDKVTASVVNLSEPVEFEAIESLFEVSPDLLNLPAVSSFRTFKIRDFNLVGSQRLGLEHVLEVHNLFTRGLTFHLDLFQLTELQSLALKPVLGACFFQHEVLPWPSIRRIHLSQLLPCLACLRALGKSCYRATHWSFASLTVRMFGEIADSFERIESLSCESVELPEIFEDSKNRSFFQKLEHLELKLANIQFEIAFREWPSMPRLRYLNLHQIYSAEFEGFKPDLRASFEGFVRKTPALRSLVMNESLGVGLPDLMTRGWPYLKDLQVRCLEDSISREELFDLLRNFPNLVKLKIDMSISDLGEDRIVLQDRLYKEFPSMRCVVTENFQIVF